MTPPRRDLILLSGGLDSTTALALRHHAGTAARTLAVDYGQRHRRELDAAETIALHYLLPHHTLDLTGWGKHIPGSALTDDTVNVPHGQYNADTMTNTVVPNRNAVFLTAAAGIAQAHSCTHVVTAVHSGDHHVYPDCRPAFIDAARHTIELGTDGAVTLDAPFVDMSKTAIAARAADLNAPVHLSWSCYEGGMEHCGKCGTCTERRACFAEAGVADPTIYRQEVPA